MAQYKYSHYLTNSSGARFDPAHPPGTVAPESGIYKCQGCGEEIVAAAGTVLPDADHHPHVLKQREVLWRLIVAVS